MVGGAQHEQTVNTDRKTGEIRERDTDDMKAGIPDSIPDRPPTYFFHLFATQLTAMSSAESRCHTLLGITTLLTMF